LLTAGRTMDDALALVCRHLGQETTKERERIRTAYYAFKNSKRAVSIDIWRGSFYSWAEWVLTVGPAELKQVSADYIRIGNQDKATWFSDFMQRLRDVATITDRGRVVESTPSPLILPA
jgi:hypothetical protein